MRRSERGGLVVTAAVLMTLAFVSTSCKRGPEPLRIHKVLVEVEPGAEGPGGVLEREKVRSLVEAALEADARFQRTEDRDDAVFRARLESTALLPPAAGTTAGAVLGVTVEVSGGVPGAPLKRYEYRGHSLASLARGPDSGGVDFNALFRQAFDDAAAQVLAARAAHDEDSAVLLAWIDDEEAAPEKRRQAVRILGGRKDARAVPSLIRALASDDDDLAQAALGALTRIGDASAAAAVVEYASGKPDLVRKRQAIEALRVMGSSVGKAWLFTMSTGHPDTDLRVSAERALAELEQRPVDLAVTRVAERSAGEEPAEAPQ